MPSPVPFHDDAADAHGLCLEAAARELGVPTAYVRPSLPGVARRASPWLRLETAGGAFFYRRGVLRHGVGDDGLGAHINGAAVAVTRHTAHTKRFLALRGVPVPAGAVFTRADERKARVYFQALGRAVRVKPNRRHGDASVAERVEDEAAFAAAFAAVAARGGEILVEEDVEGTVTRFLYVAPRVVAVAGDGVHPSYAAVAEAAGLAIPGVLLAGIDMVLREPALPAAPGNHWVLTVSGSPAIAAFPRAALAIVRLLERGARA